MNESSLRRFETRRLIGRTGSNLDRFRLSRSGWSPTVFWANTELSVSDRGSHWVTHDVLSYIQGIIYTIRE